MVSSEEAYEIVMRSAYTLETERVGIHDSLSRVLAEDLFSDINMPPFNKSAMDGYACRREDLNNEMEVIEVIQAGSAPVNEVGKKQCSKIMTGAMVPVGADCVIMVEQTVERPNGMILFTGEETNTNICYIGEDVKQDEMVMKQGTRITPRHIAVLASIGAVEPLVYRKPKMGIITTGNELVEPGEKPGLSQIRNSNGYQLYAQVISTGGIPNYYGIVEDTEDATYDIVVKALLENDVVLLTGGVSMGDFDFVPRILERANNEILFKSVAVQPGKPTLFGVIDKKFCFGLPGNPVSSFVQFELLVKPLMYKLMGSEYKPANIMLPMEVDYTRKKAKRQSWIPIIITSDGTVKPVDYHGSAHISSYCQADGMISVPIGIMSVKKGDLVHVRQI